jgi:hypothetical protein
MNCFIAPYRGIESHILQRKRKEKQEDFVYLCI